MSVVYAGAMGRKEQQREADFGANGNKAMKYLSRCDVPTSRRPLVATSPRRDVPTSRRPNVATSHVATSQRRDVATSRRQLENCIPSFKVAVVLKLGNREAYGRRHGIPEQSDTDFEEVPGICTVFHCFDIFGYENDVFTIKHFHHFIHYVLDPFLGLHRTLSY